MKKWTRKQIHDFSYMAGQIIAFVLLALFVLSPVLVTLLFGVTAGLIDAIAVLVLIVVIGAHV